MVNMWRLEDPTNYQPGGYHPVEIGDELHNGRYRIIHRLGHGAYSTVWLAVNQHYGNASLPKAPRARYVAVKIATANITNDEHTILRGLQSRPASSFIVSMLDAFEITGANGSHRCIVTELLGPSIAAVKMSGPDDWWRIPVPVGRRLALQAAKAVAFLHSRGIVHADLHLGNLAFALSVDMTLWTVDQVYAALGGEPIAVPFSDALDVESTSGGTPSHQPKYLIRPPSVETFFALCNSSAPSIRVIDFGQSFHLPFPGNTIPGTPLPFAAPELLLNQPTAVSEGIDIWALGCTIYELLGSCSLFGTFWQTIPFHLADVLNALGGEKSIPEMFCNAFSKSGALSALERTRGPDPMKLYRG
jgi:serine/threonine-protein kinase SRPK3